ncbi:MAG: DUF1836 domain-containing protein [Methylocystaceae bacterium]
MDVEKITNEITGGHTISINEVPDIELYMDQVVNFIDRRLEHLKRHEHDKIMTSTMINNYTKAGLLKAPRKKKYESSHVLELMLIYHLKQILSIQDIDNFLSAVLKEDQVSLTQLYELFLEVRAGDKDWLTLNIETQLVGIERLVAGLPAKEQESTRTNLLAMTLVLQAELLKRTAEKLLDLKSAK